MTDTIEPALTPEEWANVLHDRMLRPVQAVMRVADTWIMPEPRTLHIMAIANAALPDNEPRKITRAMVKAIEVCASLAGDHPHADEARRLADHAAAVLSALLPPE